MITAILKSLYVAGPPTLTKQDTQLNEDGCALECDAKQSDNTIRYKFLLPSSVYTSTSNMFPLILSVYLPPKRWWQADCRNFRTVAYSV